MQPPAKVAGEITIFIDQNKSMLMKNVFCLLLTLFIGTRVVCCDKNKGCCDPGLQKKPADTATVKKNAPKNTTTRQPDSKPKGKKENNNDDDEIVAPLSWRPGAFVY